MNFITFMKSLITNRGKKAEIIQIGFIDAGGKPCGFEFDCHDVIPAIEIIKDGILYGGWSVCELRSIEKERRII